MHNAILTLAEIVGYKKPEGKFEVFSIVGGGPLSSPASWDTTWDNFDQLAHAGGASNGMDVRMAT